MKKRLVLASMILLFVASFSACKKQDEETKPLREKMLGKWQVNKIDITTYTSDGKSATVSTSYAPTDYIDFKNNESDDFELGLGNTRSVGTFTSSVDNTFYLDFSSKDLMCGPPLITVNQLQFTGTVVGANPKVTETYYLSR
jgi:hypothetical protein